MKEEASSREKNKREFVAFVAWRIFGVFGNGVCCFSHKLASKSGYFWRVLLSFGCASLKENPWQDAFLFRIGNRCETEGRLPVLPSLSTKDVPLVVD